MSSREETIESAIADANRALEQKATGAGHFMVTRMDVLWLRYDPEKDGLVPAEGPYITIVPTPINQNGIMT